MYKEKTIKLLRVSSSAGNLYRIVGALPVMPTTISLLGCLDSSDRGNLWEFTFDNSDHISSNRRIRGGSYFHSATEQQIGYQFYFSSGDQIGGLALRLVR